METNAVEVVEEIEVKDVASCFRKFKDIQKKLQEDEGSRYIAGKFIFRGLADTSYYVKSSAARRLNVLNKQNDFIRYHVNLISNARKMGYGNIDMKTNLSDLEVLARIQHLGGATCLTDFTTNFLIALWFATAQKDVDGKIIWLDLGQPTNFRLINYCIDKNEDEPIQKLLKGLDFSLETKNQNKAEPCYWLWEPTRLNSRIIKQDSIFLFGLRAFPEMQDDENNLKFGTVVIPQGSKTAIREELEHFFGISAETVFYDVSGYSLNANEVKVPVSESLLSTRDCIAAAKENIKKKEYSLAINYLDEAVECHRCRNSNSEYSCKRKREERLCAHIVGEIMFWRARANEGRGYKDEAILNYHEAMEASPEEEDRHGLLYDAYRQLINLYYEKNDYRSAMKMAECLWGLYLKHPDWQNNGHDVIFSILELAVIMGNKEKFEEYIAQENSLSERLKHTNGEFLWVYFKVLGEALFTNNLELVKEGCKEINNIVIGILNNKEKENSEKASLIGYYYWDFCDIITWISKEREMGEKKEDQKDSKGKEGEKYIRLVDLNKDVFLLFTEKVNEAQNRLVNYVFANSIAFMSQRGSKRTGKSAV